MTPIPPDVAAAIVAAGHSLSAEPLPSVGYGRAQWEWHSGAAIAPRWSVSVGSFSYRSDRGSSTRETAREALLGALASFAATLDASERMARVEWKRLRNPHGKERALLDADACAKRAAEVRALAAQVAAMWPEVGP